MLFTFLTHLWEFKKFKSAVNYFSFNNSIFIVKKFRDVNVHYNSFFFYKKLSFKRGEIDKIKPNINIKGKIYDLEFSIFKKKKKIFAKHYPSNMFFMYDKKMILINPNGKNFTHLLSYYETKIFNLSKTFNLSKINHFRYLF